MKAPILAAIMLTMLAAASTPVGAQEHYPSRQITIVAPLTAGTTIDILARLFADRLSRHFGQQVIVSNRPGAAGAIGAQAVVSLPPDGYTLLFTNSGHPILGVINRTLRFDPINDFSGVALIGAAPAIVAVSPGLGISRLKEISATIIADLLGGRIQATFVPGAFILPMLEDGRLLGLAVSAKEPITDPVEVPTAASQGFNYEYETWYGILASTKTPKQVLKVLYDTISALGKDPELQTRIKAQGIDPRALGLDDFDAYIRNDMSNLAPLLRAIAANK
jgi:tripartite-type tricarboxylate transporter receptor subunit TctC